MFRPIFSISSSSVTGQRLAFSFVSSSPLGAVYRLPESHAPWLTRDHAPCADHSIFFIHRLGRRLEEVAKAVGGGYCRLQMPLRPAPGVRGTVAGHRLDWTPWRGGISPLPMRP